MGLFDQIVSAINNPTQQASSAQLGSILSTVQQVANTYGANSDNTQALLSMVGGYVRSALQEKRATGGIEQVQAIINQFSGTSPNAQAVSSLFSQTQIGQMVQEIAARTGLNAQTIQGMLPMLVPVVLNFLKTGASTENPQQGDNPVLNTFLDADGDGDVDVADAMMLAGKFLQ